MNGSEASIRPAAAGRGPLLQRDYWAVVEGCHASPAEIGRIIATRFAEFPPPELVTFRRASRDDDGPFDGGDGDGASEGGGDGAPDDGDDAAERDGRDDARPLEVGDELEVHINWARDCGVRVVHRDPQSITLATLEGHPEAGRITFGAYRNPRGEVVIHIRSRARAGSKHDYIGFLIGGDAMQTNTWTDFLNRLAHYVGEGVSGWVHVEKSEAEDCVDDADPCAPTFEAR